MRLAPVLIVLLLADVSTPAWAQSPQRLTATLSMAPPFNSSFVAPRGINNAGAIVGTASGEHGARAFFWTHKDGYSQILNTEDAREDSSASDINSHNDVVGLWTSCEEETCATHGFVWNPATGFRDLGPSFYPRAINDAGDMAGSCRGDASTACVRRDGVVTPLAPPPSAASGINEAGDVVGVSVLVDPITEMQEPQAWKWLRNGDAVNLGLGSADAINDRDVVAGFNSDGLHTAWMNAQPVTAPVGISTSLSSSIAVNDANWVVGSTGFGPDTFLGFAWNASTDQLVVLDSSDGAALQIFDINDNGLVVGSALKDGTERIVIWNIAPRQLHLTTPNTPSRWGLNTRHRLAWTYAGTAPQLKIEISRGGEDDWELIDIVDRRGGGSQSYYWTVTGATTDRARLRVSAIGDPEATDINDADIRIAPASIGVILPRSRTTTQFGSTLRIFYAHNLGAAAPVAIDVSQDGGRSWRTVVERTGTKGSTTSSFFWAVDLTPTTRARMRVRALDGSNASGVSEPFTVTAAAPGMVSE